ncbi:hypothetical protein GE09DRAFT_532807 [Coniochaeta sp. 2T2.1]|nr:hypothetical protein GE09DRAFT_532807 [Coniochaeta sp. 2T2.1]
MIRNYLKSLKGEDGPVHKCLADLQELKRIFDPNASETQQSSYTSRKSKFWMYFRPQCIFGPAPRELQNSEETGCRDGTDISMKVPGADPAGETQIESVGQPLLRSATKPEVTTTPGLQTRFEITRRRNFWRLMTSHAKTGAYEVKTAVTWPWQMEIIKTLRDRIAQSGKTMECAMQCQNLTNSEETKYGVRQMKDTQSGQLLFDTCLWLEHTNPSTRHNESWKRHERFTSEWVLRTPEWRQWTSRTNRFLWLHGIPGAG